MQRQARAPQTQPFGAEAFEASDGTVLRWLGMAGFLINSRGTTLMVDPLLGGFDMPVMIEFPIAAADVPKLDAVLVTHSDNDHYSVPTCRDLARGDRCIPLDPVRGLADATQEGLPAYGHDIGDQFAIGPVRVEVTPADHAWQNESPGASDRIFQPEDCCGFWIDTPDGTIWAPGDSRLIPDHHLQMPTAGRHAVRLLRQRVALRARRRRSRWPTPTHDTPLLLHHWGCVDAPDFPPFNADPDSLPDRVDNPERIQVLAPGEPFVLRRLQD